MSAIIVIIISHQRELKLGILTYQYKFNDAYHFFDILEIGIL